MIVETVRKRNESWGLESLNIAKKGNGVIVSNLGS